MANHIFDRRDSERQRFGLDDLPSLAHELLATDTARLTIQAERRRLTQMPDSSFDATSHDIVLLEGGRLSRAEVGARAGAVAGSMAMELMAVPTAKSISYVAKTIATYQRIGSVIADKLAVSTGAVAYHAIWGGVIETENQPVSMPGLNPAERMALAVGRSLRFGIATELELSDGDSVLRGADILAYEAPITARLPIAFKVLPVIDMAAEGNNPAFAQMMSWSPEAC